MDMPIPVPLPMPLVIKKGIKDAVLYLGWHSWAIIRDRDFDPLFVHNCGSQRYLGRKGKIASLRQFFF